LYYHTINISKFVHGKTNFTEVLKIKNSAIDLKILLNYQNYYVGHSSMNNVAKNFDILRENKIVVATIFFTTL